MSFNSEQLRQHCEYIIGSARIRKKIVVLCEGEIISPSKGEGGIADREKRLSPQLYGQMEKMPDANFYKKCVPTWWTQKRPEFFNCGDRKDVIDTYFNLLKIHEEKIEISYLSPDKLYALVDLDLQVLTIDEKYDFSDTEEIFRDLYEHSRVNYIRAKEHHIWVTGLIHKEAYFLIPELQEQIFNQFPVSPLYKDLPLDLQNIYMEMADEINNDIDLKNNLRRASARISYCSELDCNDIEKLRDSWKEGFKNSSSTKKDELIYALLTIKKAKKYWEKIKPESDYSPPVETFKDQLLLKIGEFYSKQADPKYHIPFLLKNLFERMQILDSNS